MFILSPEARQQFANTYGLRETNMRKNSKPRVLSEITDIRERIEFLRAVEMCNARYRRSAKDNEVIRQALVLEVTDLGRTLK